MPASYALADVDGKKQNAFASSSTTAQGSPTDSPLAPGKFNDAAWNPALSTPTGIHPLLVDELLPSDNYKDGVYWA